MTDFISVDWGTSSLRAYLVRDGRVTAEQAAPRGILAIEQAAMRQRSATSSPRSARPPDFPSSCPA